MSIAGLLNQPLTIQRRSTTGTDEYGNDVITTTSSVTVNGYVEQTRATEITVDRETYITDWLVFLPADVSVDGSDRIIHSTATFEIVGSPHRVWNPRTRRTHHVECRCVEVSPPILASAPLMLESGDGSYLTEADEVLAMEVV